MLFSLAMISSSLLIEDVFAVTIPIPPHQKEFQNSPMFYEGYVNLAPICCWVLSTHVYFHGDEFINIQSNLKNLCLASLDRDGLWSFMSTRKSGIQIGCTGS